MKVMGPDVAEAVPSSACVGGRFRSRSPRARPSFNSTRLVSVSHRKIESMYHQAEFLYDKVSVLVDSQNAKVVFPRDLHEELSAAVQQFQRDLESCV